MFHVEISQGLRRARVFNLDRADLVEKVVQPWLEDRRITMGEREWRPRDSELRILDGPRMETTDLAFGQGWSNAERVARDVTDEILRSAPPPHTPDAFAIETEAPGALGLEAIAGQTGRPIPWAEAREMIDGRDPRVAAVILVMRRDAG
ncbi:MAG: hypothetical protein ACM3NV_00970 [Syntrophothermus sp.]